MLQETKTILFFDTETTGLDPKISHIIQLGYIIAEYNGESYEILEKEQILINPGCEVPMEVSKINGITTDMLEFELPFKDIAGAFMRACVQADYIVGHNIDFDFRMLFSEIDRIWDDAQKREAFKKQINGKGLCTMQSSVKLCKIPKTNGQKGYKWPKLQELHKYLFGTEFAKAHSALADIEATAKCFFELHKLKKIHLQ